MRYTSHGSLTTLCSLSTAFDTSRQRQEALSWQTLVPFLLRLTPDSEYITVSRGSFLAGSMRYCQTDLQVLGPSQAPYIYILGFVNISVIVVVIVCLNLILLSCIVSLCLIFGASSLGLCSQCYRGVGWEDLLKPKIIVVLGDGIYTSRPLKMTRQTTTWT